MAGHGREPKLPENRRNRTPPSRGEWVELGPLAKPVLPTLPKRAKGEGNWSGMARLLWKAWRADPVTQTYSPADVAYCLDTIRLYDRGGQPNEVRLRMDGLGLTPKGKRDLRFRFADAAGGPAGVDRSDELAARRSEREVRLAGSG